MQPVPEGGRHLDAIGTFERLRDAYFRYYDTPFGLSDERLQGERRELLDRDGGVYRLPLLELRPEYTAVARTLAESAAQAQAPAELADVAGLGLIPGGRTLYEHQEAALASGLSPGRHMVITAGTGSGKTESFLLPVMASLLEESRTWGGRPARAVEPNWWETDDTPWAPQRAGETGRAQAIRALVLYPMNALVDDQLMRMRRALDCDAVRRWMDENRAGHRFYFGRFTGATPVTGGPTNNLAVRDLRRYLRQTSRRGRRAQQLAAEPGKEDVQYFVPRLDGAEMRSRWDMIDAPPDVLVTNYSMLNVMLMRERDGHFFDSTRAWLDASPANRFTLVVDELHMYRGTAGTEVAYLIRSLRQRLGLIDRPEKLRVLAASASLDPARDRHYLEGFFGLDADQFDFIEGATRDAGPLADAPDGAAEVLAGLEPHAAAEHARNASLLGRFRAAFHDDEEPRVTRARPAADLSARVFPNSGRDIAAQATRQVLAGLAEEAIPGDPRLRAHAFFRNVPGVWACTDPGCPDIPGGTYAERTVGRLFVEPTTRCTCGSRVLELLYCQACGDVFLGGFTPEGATQRPFLDTMMLADIPELAKLPDQVKLGRTAANFVVYWPRPAAVLSELDTNTWTRDASNVVYTFRRSALDPRSGAIRHVNADQTGWSFQVTCRLVNGRARRDPSTVSPFPTQCPACGDDWEIKYGPQRLPHTDPRTQRSPIRGMRTGFEKINQVLITELASDLGDSDRKAIVFTDSRQDAAKLSSGLALRHYQDLLRLLLYAELERRGDPAQAVELARAHVVDGARTDASWEAIRQLQQRDRAAFDALREVWEGAPGTRPEDGPLRRAPLTRAATLTELSTGLSGELLSMGVNPGGPKASLQATSERRDAPRWTALYNWGVNPPVPRGGLSLEQQQLLAAIQESLVREMLDGLFSGAGRDFESLGLGWLALADDIEPPDSNPNTPLGLSRAAVRVLGDKRRFDGMRDGRDLPPPPLKRLWETIENAGGPTFSESSASVDARCGSAMRDYILDPSQVVLRRAADLSWTCTGCRRQHLTRGCGRCTHCARPLPQEPVPLERANDYYAWKATTGGGRFRLNTAELTGQTDRLDAQSRQSRFQDVFLADDADQEVPLADGLDILSVTTTMEAGVDIGALSAVVLANMPPTRFNYQQRVGRAGRRDTPVAMALTVCRGRSHDEYYFGRPESITNDSTPKPYLALERDEIYSRALRSEVLRLATRDIFPALRARGLALDPSANVHGAFGLANDWAQIGPELQDWLEDHGIDVLAAARALADHTPRVNSVAELAEQCRLHLTADISLALAAGVGHKDLSQRLAERGLLPMFGFPSSVRYLHLSRPHQAYPWPPAKTIDRDLAMAVAQFSPLSEVVRDGRVHTVVGVAAFEPTRPNPTPVADALGPEHEISICRVCAYLAERAPGAGPAAETCPRCGAGPDAYSTAPLREPLGFRAGRAVDFDGNFSWSPRAMAARALTDLAELNSVPSGAALAYSGPGRRFVVNDNAGQLFRFREANGGQGWGGFVSVDAIDKGLLPAGAAAGDEFSVALGAVQPTDFLFYGPTRATVPEQGLRLNLASVWQPFGAREAVEGRRGAWYSLAFLLRTTAATRLDVQPLELAAGIYSGLAGDEAVPFAFIADTLENGAGFSTHLGSAPELAGLLDAVDAYLESLDAEDHAHECAASCYRCLRDYGNMAYHALLDWRLARDLFGVLRGRDLAVDEEYLRRSLDQWAISYGGTLISDGLAARFDHPQYGVQIVIPKHPLEAAEQVLMSPRLAEVAAGAEAGAGDAEGIVFIDTFTLDRDPRRVLDMCLEVQGAP